MFFGFIKNVAHVQTVVAAEADQDDDADNRDEVEVLVVPVLQRADNLGNNCLSFTITFTEGLVSYFNSYQITKR